MSIDNELDHITTMIDQLRNEVRKLEAQRESLQSGSREYIELQQRIDDHHDLIIEMDWEYNQLASNY